MTFAPVLPPAILAVVAVALISARVLALRHVPGAGPRRRGGLLRWCGLTVAVLLVLGAALRPGIGADDETVDQATAGENTNVFLVVDRSVDSGIGDYDGQPRIAGMRSDIEALIERYPRARFAVIAFASRPSLDWPLSDDVWSLDPVISALAPYAQPPEARFEVNAAAAANVLRYQLIQAAQQYPAAENLVWYFGSGAPGSRAPQSQFDSSADGGAVLGYGAVNVPALDAIADQLGVPYVQREPGQAVPVPEGAPAPQAPDAATAIPGRDVELYWLLALFAALLVLAEIYLTVRELRESRIARRDVTS